MKKTLSALFVLVSIGTIFSQVKTRTYIVDPALAPREHNVDFKHMRLEVSFDAPKGLVKGRVTHTFSPLWPQVDSIFLDAPKILIKDVAVNGKPAKFRINNDGVTIYTSLKWETIDSMTINYEATPRKGLYFIGWNDPNNLSHKQIWSQGQGIDNRNWIPMYDEMNDKMTTEVIATFDKQYKVLSNGTKLSEKENKDGSKTWHYKMQHRHAPYLVMLAIGIYDIKETKSKGGVPLHLYYYPERKNDVEATYKYSEEVMDFYDKEIGFNYGWESYSQIPVQDYMFGAMENTTATVYGDFLFVDNRSYLDRFYVGVNAHELAHQWFGDLITARSDAHHWLQESFATYYDGLFERSIFGDDHFNWGRREAQNKALEESKSNKFPVAHSEAGGTRHYPQGAFVLNMLKYSCGGREAYNKAIKYYLEKHKYDNVDSHDLLLAFEETLGLSLDWFFEEWVYKGGQPDYNVSFKEESGTTQITVMQMQEFSEVTGLHASGSNAVNAVNSDPFVSLQKTPDYKPAGLFKMPIWFEVHYTDGSVDKKMQWIEKQTEMVSIPNPSGKKIDFILFDPNNEVMKSVTFVKTFEMLKSQALRATNLLDRYDAVLAMKEMAPGIKRDLFIQLFAKETFFAIKAEIIAQLADDRDPKTIALFKTACSDKDVMVRKAILPNVKAIPVEIITDYEKLLKDPSYEAIAMALENLCSVNPGKSKEYLEITKGVIGTVGRNVEVKWLQISYNTTVDKQYMDKLIAYTSNSYEFRTRANAAQAIKRTNYFDVAMIPNLIDAVLSPNGRLANPCGETLKFFYDMDKYHSVIATYVSSRKWLDWQLELIKKFVN